MMNEHQLTECPGYQFSIRGMLLILTAVAGILCLTQNWRFQAELLIAVLVCAIPIAWVAEYALTRSTLVEPRVGEISLHRLAILLLSGLVPSAVCFAILKMGNSTRDQWYAPMPFLSYLPYMLFGSPRFLVFEYIRVLAVPALVFVFLSFPIAFHRPSNVLPIRSVTLLLISTVTSFYWFVEFLPSAHHPTSYILIVVAINILTIFGLWATWYWKRGTYSTVGTIAWNLALTTWLYSFAYPSLTN